MAAALTLIGVLGGCAQRGSDQGVASSGGQVRPAADGQELATSDFSLAVPAGWKRTPENESSELPLVAAGTDRVDQLIARPGSTPDAAYTDTLSTITSLIDQFGDQVDCAEPEPFTRFGRPQYRWSCSTDTGEDQALKTFVALSDSTRSVSLLIQTRGTSTDTATPIIDSFTWL